MFFNTRDTQIICYKDLKPQDICLMSLKPFTYKINCWKKVRQLFFQFSQLMVFAYLQLNERLNVERVPVKSFCGLCTHLENKILKHNYCMVLTVFWGYPVI